MVIDNYKHDFIRIRESEYFEELPPNLQKKLLKKLVENDKHQFSNLFRYTYNDGHKSIVSDEIIAGIFSNIELEVFTVDSNLLRNGDEVEFLYLIKDGDVSCYDENYNYITTIQNGSYFGEYNIMFGLYSSISYNLPQTNTGSSVVYLLKIEKD